MSDTHNLAAGPGGSRINGPSSNGMGGLFSLSSQRSTSDALGRQAFSGSGGSQTSSLGGSYGGSNGQTAGGNSFGSTSSATGPNGGHSHSSFSSAGTAPLGLQENIYEWVTELTYGQNREHALLELGKKREQYEDLALVLWQSHGVMTVLLQEIITVYPLLSPPQLSMTASNKVCNALALLQCVASHEQTRAPFLRAHIPLFLYPFLNTTSRARSFEYLRLTSLGVVGALVKNDSPEVVNFLLSTEIIPLCLRIIETGTELSKTVAIFIVQKILTDDTGLNYVCQTYERFFAVSAVLANVVQQLLTSQPASSRLLKHVVRCYLRLSDEPRARESLRQILPEPLRDATFSVTLRGDTATKRALTQLLTNLSTPGE